MNTSYYASPKILKKDFKLISISRKPPDWFKVDNIFLPLCPTWDLVMSYNSRKITKEEYTIRYYMENLDLLDPAKTYQALGENSVLLCYEKSGVFCHRRIVAKWLMDNLNINITEL